MPIVKGNDESPEKRTQQPTSDVGESIGGRVEKDRVRRKQFNSLLSYPFVRTLTRAVLP